MDEVEIVTAAEGPEVAGGLGRGHVGAKRDQRLQTEQGVVEIGVAAPVGEPPPRGSAGRECS